MDIVNTKSADCQYPQQIPLIADSFTDPGRYLEGPGYFSILIRNADMTARQTSYPVRQMTEILPYLDPRKDTWISQAQFHKRNRRLVNLLQICLSFVDLDAYTVPELAGKSPWELLDILLEFCGFNRIPIPSLVLYSGRGLQVKWIYPDALPPVALPRWNHVQKALCDRLAPLGADKKARDASRVLRLEHCINTKSGEVARVIYDSGRNYNFSYLADLLLKWTQEEVRAYRQRTTELHAGMKIQPIVRPQKPLNTVYWHEQLYWDRLGDLRLLCKLRGWHDGAPEGMRDHTLFLATCFLGHAMPTCNLGQEVTALAREFSPSLPYHEAQGMMSAAIKRHRQNRLYVWSNDRLIDDLGITGTEELKLKTIISRGEKNKRHVLYMRGVRDGVSWEDHIMKRKEAAEENRLAVVKLHEAGFTVKAISEALRLHRSRVHFLLNAKPLIINNIESVL